MKIPFKLNKENGLIFILIGILCLVVVWPTNEAAEESKSSAFYEGNQGAQEDDDQTLSLSAYVKEQESRLREILEKMDGVGNVEVMIRASASKAYVVEKDVTTNGSVVLETDSNGGTRNSSDQTRNETSIYTKDSKGNDIPLVVKELEPEIEGVLVAAQGGNMESLVSEITQAVQVLFDIPVHKIKVVKMKVD